METARIAELLLPFTTDLELPPDIFGRLERYLDLLLHWNARINLTAIRDPEQIVTRHFGESLFVAKVLFGSTDSPPPSTLADLGSGAGFPGLPVKLAFSALRLTLIESRDKKATFLKEVIRALNLEDVEVYGGRAQSLERAFDVVTLRAVERFEAVLSVAARLVAPGARLCLLIGASQTGLAERFLAGEIQWQVERNIAGSRGTVVKVGRKLATPT